MLEERLVHAYAQRRIMVHPKHVHKALRRHHGIQYPAGARRFPFNNTEDFDFFS